MDELGAISTVDDEGRPRLVFKTEGLSIKGSTIRVQWSLANSARSNEPSVASEISG